MKIKDYNDAIEFFRTNDYQAADGAWSEFYQSEVLEPRITDQASIADDLEPGSLKDEMLKDFDPSQETYEEYLQRKRLGERPFNMAEGGQLVRPSVDGSRPGYQGTGATPLESKGISLTEDQLNLLKEKLTPQEFRKLKFGQARKKDALDVGVFQRYKITDPEVKSGVKKVGKKNRLFYKVNNILFPGKYETGRKILNNKKWTDTVIKLTKAGKSSDDIVEVLIKSDKKITRNMVSSAINALVKQNKLNDKYTVMGSTGYTKAEMAEVDNIIKKEVADGELGRADIGRKAEISDSYVEKWIRENKGNKFYENNYSYEQGKLKKGTLQKQKDLFKLVESGGDLSLENVNKVLGIKNSKTVMADLVSTIYRMTGNRRTNSLIVPYDDEPRMREVLNKIRSSPDFEDIYQRRMGSLIRDAYVGKPILKEKALKAFNEYTQFNRQLRLVAPEIANQLDHVVPYQFLDEVKQGGNAINLIKVKPIPAAVNKFKSYFDKARIDVARELRINPNNLDALAKFKLLRDLEKSMPLEFGGISEKGYVYDFKQKPIGKSDLIADAKDAVRLYNETGKFSQKVLKDKKLQKKIIDAGVGTGENLSIFKTIKPLSEERTLKIKNVLNGFCKSPRKKFATAGVVDGLVCSMDEIQENIKKQTNQAMKVTKDGKIPKKFGRLRSLGMVFGWADAPIEFYFAAPHLIAGDVEGAKRATTAGLAGWGKVDLDNISDEKAQRYLKHTQAMNDYFDNYSSAINAENQLENMEPGSEDYLLISSQFERAKTNMDKIQEDYQSYGYTYQDGDIPMKDKVATQNYIRNKVKSDFENKIENIASNETFQDADQELLKEQLRDLGGRPEKVTPITNLESYMENKGEEMAGNTNWFFNVKPYVLEEAEALGVGDIFDDYAAGAGVEAEGRKSLQDAYSEIPLEYANELAALEKKQLEEGLKKKRIQQILKNEYFSQGGIASLKK